VALPAPPLVVNHLEDVGDPRRLLNLSVLHGSATILLWSYLALYPRHRSGCQLRNQKIAGRVSGGLSASTFTVWFTNARSAWLCPRAPTCHPTLGHELHQRRRLAVGRAAGPRPARMITPRPAYDTPDPLPALYGLHRA
jgi:hypothetical protein